MLPPSVVRVVAPVAAVLVLGGCFSTRPLTTVPPVDERVEIGWPHGTTLASVDPTTGDTLVHEGVRAVYGRLYATRGDTMIVAVGALEPLTRGARGRLAIVPLASPGASMRTRHLEGGRTALVAIALVLVSIVAYSILTLDFGGGGWSGDGFLGGMAPPR